MGMDLKGQGPALSCNCKVQPCKRSCVKCKDCSASYSRYQYARKGIVRQSSRWVRCIICDSTRRAGGNDHGPWILCQKCKVPPAFKEFVPKVSLAKHKPVKAVESMACEFCGKYEHTQTEYNRGRGGRPYNRMIAHFKKHGSHYCWICGSLIDMTLHHLDDWAWSIDHVYALSRYPCLALDYGNLREAHRICNMRKGNGTHIPKTRNSRDW